MKAVVRTAHGVFAVDLDDELVQGGSEDIPPAEEAHVELPRLVAAVAAGSTVVALLDRRPPLAVSHDAGRTWREAGGGLPAGRAVALAADHPDLVLFAARNRLYLSEDGGRFWRALAPELPEIEAIALTEA